MHINEKFPEHIAVIMDGNGRWARERGLSRLEGHRKGVEQVRTLVECCIEKRISYLTLFAFSSENWRRPKQEVSWLMNLLSRALDREVRSLHENQVRLSVIGDITKLPEAIQKKIEAAKTLTENNNRLCLTIALNYGGKWDLTEACRKVAHSVVNGEAALDDISAESLSKCLSTSWMPEPDLFIRTGGEQRISNFMLWQLAYTELYFTDTYWPEFGREEFNKSLASYQMRVRRFGQTDDQVEQAEHVKKLA